MVNLGQIWAPQGPSKGPSGQRVQIGTFWPEAKGLGSGGLKMGQNRVKMAFSLTPDRQNVQN